MKCPHTFKIQIISHPSNTIIFIKGANSYAHGVYAVWDTTSGAVLTAWQYDREGDHGLSFWIWNSLIDFKLKQAIKKKKLNTMTLAKPAKCDTVATPIAWQFKRR